jgi:hypothetical protein
VNCCNTSAVTATNAWQMQVAAQCYRQGCSLLGRFTYHQWTLTVESFRFHLWQANTEHILYVM